MSYTTSSRNGADEVRPQAFTVHCKFMSFRPLPSLDQQLRPALYHIRSFPERACYLTVAVFLLLLHLTSVKQHQ